MSLLCCFITIHLIYNDIHLLRTV
ncbi:hypothetical protein EXW35_21035 [Bacillus mycoides]|nr:hypothetical protein EXW35_21035 [Bacillus mycoides]